MIAFGGQLVTISITWNNCVHDDDDDDDNDNIYNEIYLWFFLLLHSLFVHGYTFRHILASLHFNENLQGDTQLTKEGEKYFKVTYPKYKLGDEFVREVASPPTYCEFNYSTVCNYDCSAVTV